MVAAGIFTLLLLTLVAFLRGRGRWGIALFTASLVATLLLFLHHATDTLELSF